METSDYKPDCGYAWIIVAACFAINFIMAGLVRAAGVLYIALIDVYGVSREVATTPFSLRFCVRNLSGPAVGALGQRFGIRPVVLLGGLICGLGGILSALAPDVTWITVSWGGIHGLGYGMCNLIHVILINRYFHKYKGFALGLSLTGDCVGTFLLPLLLEFLLSIYDLRGTFLILAGISLNVVPAAMLLKSPPWENRVIAPSSVSQNETEPIKYNNQNCHQGKTNEGFDGMPEDCGVKIAMNNDQGNILSTIAINAPEDKHVVDDKESETMVTGTRKSFAQYIDFSCNNVYKNNLMDDYVINDTVSLSQPSNLREQNGKIKQKRFRCNINTFNPNNRATCVTSCTNYPLQLGKFSLVSQTKNPVNLNNTCLKTPAETLHDHHQKQNICLRHGKEELETVNESLLINKSPIDNNKLQTQLNLSFLPLTLNEKIKLKPSEGSIDVKFIGIHDDLKNQPTENAVLIFLKTNIKPIFLIISATMALYVFLFISVFTIVVDYVHDNGFPSDCGKYLIIAFSVTDFFGRIGLGIVLDKKWIPLSHFAGLSVGLMGFFILIIPVYKSFAFWMISFGLCGFVQGGTAIMFPVLVENYMKKEETIALGSLNFYGGILMLPIPPMIGYFRDNIGSYDGVFWTVGTLCIFAASLWIWEPCLVNKEKKHIEGIMQFTKNENNDQRQIITKY